jgi:hypothetical protein
MDRYQSDPVCKCGAQASNNPSGRQYVMYGEYCKLLQGIPEYRKLARRGEADFPVPWRDRNLKRWFYEAARVI